MFTKKTIIYYTTIKKLTKIINHTIVVSNAEARQYIVDVSKNYQQNRTILSTRLINPGKPLSNQEIIEKAEKVFANHPNKNKVLEKIKNKLTRYQNQLNNGTPPTFESNSKSFNFRRDLLFNKEVTLAVENFLSELPGIDTTPYQGPELA